MFFLGLVVLILFTVRTETTRYLLDEQAAAREAADRGPRRRRLGLRRLLLQPHYQLRALFRLSATYLAHQVR